MAVETRQTDEELRRILQALTQGQAVSGRQGIGSVLGMRGGPGTPASAPAQAPLGSRPSGLDQVFNPSGSRSGGRRRPREQDLQSMETRDQAKFQNQRGLGGSPTQQSPVDPYGEFMSSYMSSLAGSYDDQIAAIAGLGPLYEEQAQEAQGNIGEFFGYAGDVAREGIPVTQEVYGTAEGNVNAVYDQLGERLQGMPQQLVDVASQAAGGAIGGSVAGGVAESIAPFAAAGETSRANAVANLTQHSSAGQSYLNNLASATGAESAMQQSAVEQALNQQLQMIAFKGAELEGAKSRALMEVSADVSGETSERMANAALSQALGLDLPGEGMIDPLDYLRGTGNIAGMEQDQIGMQQALLNLGQDADPQWRENQVLSGMSDAGRNLFESVRSTAESSFDEMTDDPKKIGYQMIAALEDLIGQEQVALDEQGLKGAGLPQFEQEIRNAIRALYGG